MPSSEDRTFRCVFCGSEHREHTCECPSSGRRIEAVHRMESSMLDDKYLVRRYVAEGGMGVVYEGVNRDIGRRVAIKFLTSSTESHDDIVRFENEARIAASLGHRNIVDVLDMGVTQAGIYYIVMEYLQGDDLSQLLDEAIRLPFPWAVDITIQILQALGQVHSRGIIHQDLKPGNILLVQDPDGGMTVKILDFGISCLRRASSVEQDGIRSHVMGTPRYMSPEQVAGSLDLDHRSDLYAVAVMLYRMITGAFPFEDEDPEKLMLSIATGQPMLLSKHGVPVPPGLEAVIMWGLQNDPDERFADADEFIEALRPFCDPVEGESADLTPVIQGLALGSSEEVTAPLPTLDPGMLSSPPLAPGGSRGPRPEVTRRVERTLPTYSVDVQGIPVGAEISVDGVPHTERPILLVGRPGLRKLRIEADGQPAWERAVNIHSNTVVFVDWPRKR